VTRLQRRSAQVWQGIQGILLGRKRDGILLAGNRSVDDTMSELRVLRGNPKRCWRKTPFATRGLAIHVASAAMIRKWNKDNRAQMSVYCCPHCNRWHLVRCRRTAANLPKELTVWDGNPTGLSRSREACISFRSIDSLVCTFDPQLRPRDKRNVVRCTDLCPNVTHQAKKDGRAHAEFLTHLSVGLSSGKGSQHDCLFASQGWADGKLKCGG
jgi:hypothetical protein